MQIECHVFAGTPSRDDWGKKWKDRVALLTRSHQHF
jgi:hypothetical protein